MKKTYTAPALEEVGTVAGLTAAFGTSPRNDFNEFSQQVGNGSGSFDVCDPNRQDSDPNSNCNQPL